MRIRNALQDLCMKAVTLVPAAVALAAPGFAQARKQEDARPPYDVTGLDPGYTWVPWVFAFLFIALCTATCLKNPHRMAQRES